MWELDYKESWKPRNWCFWTVVLEKTLESPLDCKEIQPVHPKGNQSWIFIERMDAEAGTPILWPPDVRNWLTGKDPDAGKDWRWEEKGMTEDEIVGWHHWINGHEFQQPLGAGIEQGSLANCSLWVANSWTWLSYWTNYSWIMCKKNLGLFEANFYILTSLTGWNVLDKCKCRQFCWSFWWVCGLKVVGWPCCLFLGIRILLFITLQKAWWFS